MKKRMVAMAAVVAAAALCAVAQTRQSAPAFVSTLPKQPREAPPALKATIGKPFIGGYVFIDGKYVRPPYKVERYGTVLRVNGIQVTGQLIPWNEFLKTQEGVKVTKTEVAPPPAAEPAAPEPEPVEEVSLDDVSSDLDDLFADEPVKPKKAASASRPRRAPRPRQPTTVVTYTLEGPFVPNARTKAMVDRINDARTKLDGKLRNGWYYFFGSRYSVISGDASVAVGVIGQVCDAMKKSSTVEQFAEELRHTDAAAFPRELLEDLFRNKIDYVPLEKRVREERDRRELQRMLNR